MADTKIQWTDRTWNPTRGCSIVSAGCTNCYAMKQAHRFSGPGKPYEGLTKMSPGGPVWTGKVRCVPEKLDEPLHWRKPCKVFVNSMSDLFHEDVPDEFILQVFDVMRECQNGYTRKIGGERGHLTTAHTFQILTKRAARMFDFCSRLRFAQNDGRGMYLAKDLPHNGFNPMRALTNVWLGVSCEDQRAADERIPLLLQTPAAVRFVSYEPALGPIDFNAIPRINHEHPHPATYDMADLDWVIVGGESGPKARPFDLDWARSTIAQCKAAGVSMFYKQGGASNACAHDRAGAHFECFPVDLRVREFPT